MFKKIIGFEGSLNLKNVPIEESLGDIYTACKYEMIADRYKKRASNKKWVFSYTWKER